MDATVMQRMIQREIDIRVTRGTVASPASHPHRPHLALLYVEKATGPTATAGDLRLLSPFEAVAPSGSGDALYWSVSFAPEVVVTSERGGVYFYWLCNPLFFAFVATRGTPLRVPQNEQPAWAAHLGRLERETSLPRTGSAEEARAL
jgi:hypothetical protein